MWPGWEQAVLRYIINMNRLHNNFFFSTPSLTNTLANPSLVDIRRTFTASLHFTSFSLQLFPPGMPLTSTTGFTYPDIAPHLTTLPAHCSKPSSTPVSSARSSQILPSKMNHCLPQAPFGFMTVSSAVESVLRCN